MATPQQIITDDEIEAVHGNANFGRFSKRSVVDDGVLKAAFGYSCVSTMHCILEEHGLIKRYWPRRHKMDLTKKGFEYLRAAHSHLLRRPHDVAADPPENDNSKGE